MATIQERKNRNGKTSYRAIVRLKGVPPQTATFVRKTDARNWAHRVETEVRERRYFPKAIAGNHNLAEAITRYLEDVMPRKSRSAYTQKGQLQWWSNELGVYSLADLTPDVIIGARDRLLKKPNKTGGKLSKATVNRYMAALSHVLSVARDEWRWLDEPPMPMVGKLKEAKGRVPYLVTDEGVGLEESQLIIRHLDHLDGNPVFDHPGRAAGWESRRLEALARSMLDGQSVWGRELHRAADERSPTIIDHERYRSRRMAEVWEAEIDNPLMTGDLNMAQITLIATLLQEHGNPGIDWRTGHPKLEAWAAKLIERPSIAASLPPDN